MKKYKSSSKPSFLISEYTRFRKEQREFRKLYDQNDFFYYWDREDNYLERLAHKVRMIAAFLAAVPIFLIALICVWLKIRI